jgi:hypothetical protein
VPLCKTPLKDVSVVLPASVICANRGTSQLVAKAQDEELRLSLEKLETDEKTLLELIRLLLDTSLDEEKTDELDAAIRLLLDDSGSTRELELLSGMRLLDDTRELLLTSLSDELDENMLE